MIRFSRASYEHERTGRRVDLMGHSQGGLLPRWAIKFWPSVQAAVDDAVLVAPPSHGTGAAWGPVALPLQMPAAVFQMGYDARFIAALNAGDETPGDVDWSVLYTDFDEAVQPSAPVPTAALDWGAEGDNVRNVRIQDVCPGRLVDHLTIGTTDRLSQELVLDAFASPGPVDPARLAPASRLCALPDQYLDPRQLAALAEQAPRSFSDGFPGFHIVDEEPPLKPYAAAVLAAQQGPSDPQAPRSDPAGEDPDVPNAAVSDGEVADASAAGAADGGSTLPATGGGGGLAAAGAAGAAGLAARRLRRRTRAA